MFDFEKVLKMMKAVNWLYLGEPVSLKSIKDTASLVIHKAQVNKSTVRTGGFMCTYPEMEIFFIGESHGIN